MAVLLIEFLTFNMKNEHTSKSDLNFNLIDYQLNVEDLIPVVNKTTRLTQNQSNSY